MKTVWPFVLVFTVFLTHPLHAAQSCSTSLDPGMGKVLAGVETLSARLSPLLAAHDARRNLIFSDFNVLSALHLLYPGTSHKGRTQMAKVLNVSSLEMERAAALFGNLNAQLNAVSEGGSGATRIHTFYSLWANHRDGFTFDSRYLDVVAQSLRSGAHTLDFASPHAREVINLQVAEATDGMIRELLPALSPDLASVAVSALFIEGAFAQPFSLAATRTAPFERLEGSSKPIAMMNASKEFEYGETRDVQAVRLPTRDARAFLEVTLPKRHHPEAVTALRDRFIASKSSVVPPVFRRAQVALSVPRFRVQWARAITSELARIVPAVFVMGGLNGLGAPPVTVGEVLHESVLEVNEGGFRAAAASAVLMARAMVPPPEITMNVNRGFGVRVVVTEPGFEVELMRGWIDDPEPLTAPVTQK